MPSNLTPRGSFGFPTPFLGIPKGFYLGALEASKFTTFSLRWPRLRMYDAMETCHAIEFGPKWVMRV